VAGKWTPLYLKHPAYAAERRAVCLNRASVKMLVWGGQKELRARATAKYAQQELPSSLSERKDMSDYDPYKRSPK
jgi:hypothetical protein